MMGTLGIALFNFTHCTQKSQSLAQVPINSLI